MFGWLKNEGTVFVATRKSEAADELSKFGAAIRRAAENLNEQNSGAAAKYAETAADGIDRAAQYLQKANLDRLIEDASRAAKRNPSLFLGGAFLAGLAAARFTKSAGARPSRR
jgi:hypothetical protein